FSPFCHARVKTFPRQADITAFFFASQSLTGNGPEAGFPDKSTLHARTRPDAPAMPKHPEGKDGTVGECGAEETTTPSRCPATASCGMANRKSADKPGSVEAACANADDPGDHSSGSRVAAAL